MEFEVISDTGDTIKDLDSLTESLSKLQKVARKKADFSSITSGLRDIRKELEGMTGLSDLAKLIDASELKKKDGELKDTAKTLREVADISTVTRSDNSTTPDTASRDSVSSNQSVVPEIKTDGIVKVKSSLGDVLKQLGEIGKNAGMKALNAQAKILKTTLSGTATVLKGLSQSSLNPFKGIADGVQSATSSFKQFTSSLGRIAMYRAVRAILSAITKDLKTGIDNLYQYSKAMSGTFAASMDKIATSSQYLRNSFGAMASPLINSLAPAIDYIIDKLVALMNVINQVFARLTGASSYTRAIKQTAEYADATNDAAGALKSFTLGFDELNVLDNSSGSSSAAGADFSNMFEEVAIDNEISAFVDSLREAFENGEWAELGRILGEKVNEIVDGIDFDGLGAKFGTGLNNVITVAYSMLDTINFDNIGAGVARFLNNAFENLDFFQLGQLLAKKISIAVDLAAGFIEDFNWSQFGVKVGDLINGWFDEIDFVKMGATLAAGINGVFESLTQAVRTIKWAEIGQEFSDGLNRFIADIDLSAIGTSLSELWNGVVTLLSKVITETKWSDFAVKLGEGINTFIREVDWAGTAKLLSDSVITILDTVSDFIASINWFDVGQSMYEAVSNIDFVGIISAIARGIVTAFGGFSALVVGRIKAEWDSICDWWANLAEENGGNIILGLLKGVLNGIANIGKWIVDNIFTPFINGFKSAFGIHSPSTVMIEMGGYLVDGLFGGLSDTWGSIVTFFSDKAEDIKTTLSTAWDNVKSTAIEKWTDITGELGDKWENIKQDASEKFEDIKTKIGEAWENTKTNASEKWEEITGDLGTTWQTLKGTAETKFKNIRETIAGAWGDAETDGDTTWASIVEGLSDSWDDISKNATEKFEEIKSSILEIWGGIWSGIKGVINNILEGVEKWINNVIKAINTLISSIVGAFATVAEFVGFTIDIPQLSEVSLPRLYENGGFPTTGELFIANEAGAEMVGRIGNRTAVANTDQIVAGVANGVSDGIMPLANVLLTAASQIVQSIEENSTEVNIGDDAIGQANARYTRRRGATVNTGAFSNAY